MKLRITHQTRYDYAPAVSLAQHIAFIQPRNTLCQHLLDYALHIAPEPALRSSSSDVFGNVRQYFALQNAHQQLDITAYSTVKTQASIAPQPSSIAWESVRDRLSATSPYDAATEFSFASPHVPCDPAFAKFASASFSPGRPLADGVHDLMRRIHHELVYESQSTHVNTPALVALEQRKGVCQDFAHIMLAALRTLGLSARYVSGYVLNQNTPMTTRLIGGDASHAWVSVYLPDGPPAHPWLDLDPTNLRAGWGSPGEDYVILAIGRDYADVSPLRGVIYGGAEHTLSVNVTVEAVSN
jgi:transglutaminase-like putative cysteine protease